jgi:hypothetical protein
MSKEQNEPVVSPFAEYANKYIALGISILPIAPNSKKPGQWTQEHGWRGMSDWTRFNKRLPTEIEIAEWSSWPGAGIGVVTGELSGLVGIDKDYDIPNGGNDALHAIIPYSPFIKKGEKGWTRFFAYNGERSCSFNVGTERVLDILSDGRQTVVPPSGHPSGCSYIWISESSLAEINSIEELPALPADFMDQVERVLAPYQTVEDKKYQAKKIAPQEGTKEIDTELSISAGYYKDLNRLALNDLQAWVPRLIPTAIVHNVGYRCIATWRKAENHNVGIHPDGIRDHGGNYGMTPLDLVMYARQIPFARAAEELRECFASVEPAPIVFGGMANAEPPKPKPALPWLKSIVPPAPPTIHVPSKTSVDLEVAMPSFILNPPGMLGEITRWINATASKQQPELAVAAAISLCSVIMARNYVTQIGNYSSLYMILIAKSTEGKEHPQDCITRALADSGLSILNGGSGYTSAGAVHTALLKSPSHLVVIDEIGKMIKASRSAGNSHGEAAIDKLVEAFGRCGGVMAPPTYSNMTGSDKVSKNSDRTVHNPGITLLGATTPDTFYANLTDDLVKDGFLGRCIVIQSHRARQLTQFVEKTPPPANIIDWCKSVHLSQVIEGEGNLSTLSIAEIPAHRTLLPFDDACLPLFKTLEASLNEAKDAAEGNGLDTILGRTVEKAMRLSMIVAKARDKKAKTITVADAEWSIEYVRFYDMAQVRAIETERFENEYQATAKRAIEIIGRAKKLSATTKNLSHKVVMRDGAMPHSALLQRMNMTAKQLATLIETLLETEQILVAPAGDFKGVVYRVND